MKSNKRINEFIKIIRPILKKHKVYEAGIFGSVARGETKKNSDIDLLINIDKEVSLLGLSSLKIELEEKLKKKVDLVEYSRIKPRIKSIILNEEIKII